MAHSHGQRRMMFMSKSKDVCLYIRNEEIKSKDAYVIIDNKD